MEFDPRFINRNQHSIRQLDFVERLAAHVDRLPLSEAMYVANQLVIQVSDQAESILQRLKPRLSHHPDALAFLGGLGKQLAYMQHLTLFQDVKNDRAVWSKLYDLDRFFFAKGSSHPEKLLVVFTTMFNNFGISNAALFAILKELGVSVLILKDGTYFNFLNGVSGLGSDIPSVANGISAIASDNHISEIFVTGFSSGGFASLYASLLLPCSGYLGFSVPTDLSHGSTRFPPKFFTEEVRRNVDEKHLINLRTLAKSADLRVPREIVFGELTKIDAVHAANMVGLSNFKITKLGNCGHQTVVALIENHSFSNCLRNLLFRTEEKVRDL